MMSVDNSPQEKPDTLIDGPSITTPTPAPVFLDPEDIPTEIAPSPMAEEPSFSTAARTDKLALDSSASKAPNRPRPDSFVDIELAGSSSMPPDSNSSAKLDPEVGSGSTSSRPADVSGPSSSGSSKPQAEASSSRGVNNSTTTKKAEDAPATEYYLKTIDWTDLKTGTAKIVRIVTQNENGPCPLVALANVLLLRGDIEIRPFDRPYVTYEYLAEMLGDYLLNHAPADTAAGEGGASSSGKKSNETKDEEDAAKLRIYDYRYNLNAALSIIPCLQTGLDVNVRFTSPRSFEPTPELALFDAFNTDVVHGWLPDPQDEETYSIVATKAGSYNKAVELVVAGDVAGQGVVVESSSGSGSAAGKSLAYTDGAYDLGKKSTWGVGGVTVKEALITSQFLDSTATQLTYYGLQFLMDSLPDNQLCILFRNNHFSTLYKHPATSSLYTLVTDAGFVNERAVVWESLRDIDQAAAEFYDGWFMKTEFTGAGGSGSGDWVGLGGGGGRVTGWEDEDYALALKLQKMENERARQYQQQRKSTTQAAKLIDLRAAGAPIRAANGPGMGIGALPPPNIGVVAKEIARREERGKGRAEPLGDDDKSKKKDSCVLM